MKKYDIFKSEGGYRYCGAIWGNDPIIDQSPWFATRREAEKAVRRARADAEFRGLLDACLTCATLGEIRGEFARLEAYARSHARLLPASLRSGVISEAIRILEWFEDQWGPENA